METMYWNAFWELIGINILCGIVIAIVVISVLCAKEKPFEAFYGGMLMFLLSPICNLYVIPFAIMYVIKSLREVK